MFGFIIVLWKEAYIPTLQARVPFLQWKPVSSLVWYFLFLLDSSFPNQETSFLSLRSVCSGISNEKVFLLLHCILCKWSLILCVLYRYFFTSQCPVIYPVSSFSLGLLSLSKFCVLFARVLSKNALDYFCLLMSLPTILVSALLVDELFPRSFLVRLLPVFVDSSVLWSSASVWPHASL